MTLTNLVGRSLLRSSVSSWTLMTLVLIYVSVPPLSAILISAALTIQGLLGTVVLTKLFELPGSVLMIAGPGLILGGAISVGVFQITGRGGLGLSAAAILGLASMIRIQTLDHATLNNLTWTLGQTVGLALLALSTEHSELIPFALALLLAGIVLGHESRNSRWLVVVVTAICLIVGVLSFVWRRDYWWLVTDDYQHIEIIMRHVTKSGPFADWGAYNYGTSYHWLSNAWAGLLDEYGAHPGAFVTTSRVMPMVYALSMSASLLLVAGTIGKDAPRSLVAISAWAIVASINLDWAGISTGGIYAVLSAAVAVAFLGRSSQGSFITRTLSYTIFIPIAILTKAPSIVSIIAVGLCAVLTSLLARLRNRWLRLGGVALAVAVSLAAAFLAIGLLAYLSDGRMRLALSNPALGQLSTLEPEGVLALSTLQHSWLIVPGLLLYLSQGGRHVFKSLPYGRLIPSALTALTAGILIQMTVVTNAGDFKYFSGPMFFFASLTSFMLACELQTKGASDGHSARGPLILYLFVLGFALYWKNLRGIDQIWNLVAGALPDYVQNGGELLKFVTRDTRFGAAFAAMVLSIVLLSSKSGQRWLRYALLAALATAPSISAYGQAWDDFRRTRNESEIAMLLGESDSREVGAWLRNNSGSEELIATNHLVTADGAMGDDFSLAVWSEREFFLIGPRFHVGDSSRVEPAYRLSMNFMTNTESGLCDAIRQAGVAWFVEDNTVTEDRKPPDCIREEHKRGRFTVWRIMAANPVPQTES